MIRFLNLKNQICEGNYDFAFYDTVTDTICYFGTDKQQVFEEVFEFQYAYSKDLRYANVNIDRFLNLIPKDYFNE